MGDRMALIKTRLRVLREQNGNGPRPNSPRRSVSRAKRSTLLRRAGITQPAAGIQNCTRIGKQIEGVFSYRVKSSSRSQTSWKIRPFQMTSVLSSAKIPSPPSGRALIPEAT